MCLRVFHLQKLTFTAYSNYPLIKTFLHKEKADRRTAFVRGLLISWKPRTVPGSPSDLKTGNGTEGAMVCTSLGSLLRPLQPADIGWLTGNRKKLSCCQVQLSQATCLAVAYLLSISCRPSYVRRLYSNSCVQI